MIQEWGWVGVAKFLLHEIISDFHNDGKYTKQFIEFIHVQYIITNRINKSLIFLK